jgi:hypothetical protein
VVPKYRPDRFHRSVAELLLQICHVVDKKRPATLSHISLMTFLFVPHDRLRGYPGILSKITDGP